MIEIISGPCRSLYRGFNDYLLVSAQSVSS